MKNILFGILVLAAAVSCKKNDDLRPATADKSDAKVETAKNCYLAVLGKDSVRLTLNSFGDKLSGNLIYDRFETDGSFGTVDGIKAGDTVKLHYRFESEGMVSHRDVYFLERDGKLLEGFGNVRQINDSMMIFDQPSALEYGNSYILEKTECK